MRAQGPAIVFDPIKSHDRSISGEKSRPRGHPHVLIPEFDSRRYVTGPKAAKIRQ